MLCRGARIFAQRGCALRYCPRIIVPNHSLSNGNSFPVTQTGMTFENLTYKLLTCLIKWKNTNYRYAFRIYIFSGVFKNKYSTATASESEYHSIIKDGEKVKGPSDTMEFQAETRMLLDIVARSLYSEKEVSSNSQCSVLKISLFLK